MDAFKQDFEIHWNNVKDYGSDALGINKMPHFECEFYPSADCKEDEKLVGTVVNHTLMFRKGTAQPQSEQKTQEHPPQQADPNPEQQPQPVPSTEDKKEVPKGEFHFEFVDFIGCATTDDSVTVHYTKFTKTWFGFGSEDKTQRELHTQTFYNKNQD